MSAPRHRPRKIHVLPLSSNLEAFRFVISATFTAEPLEFALNFWGRQLQTPVEVRFAPYNQLVQTLAGPSSDFALNRNGVNTLLLRLEDLAQFDNAPDETTLARIEENLEELIRAAREALPRLTAPLLFVLCPPSPAFCTSPARREFAHQAAIRVEAMLEGTPGVLYLSHEEIERLYPVAEPFNPHGDRLGRIPFSDLYFSALATALVRTVHSFFAPPYKLIALDCDNTLWKGICGEDGPQGVVVDPPRRKLQEFMREQHDAGMLLTMASKNNEGDVLETFGRHPEMPLQLRHFVSWRLSWDAKSLGLQSLAAELSLGLDSVMLVDDNLKECAEVSDAVPEVLALPLPSDPEQIPHFLDHVWAFDHAVLTEEDRHRTAYYKSSLEFGRELKQASSMERFLESLALHLNIRSAQPSELARVAQLTQRTNQFNFSTVRRTESEIASLLASHTLECLAVDVSDRFGEYGLTGVALFRVTADALEIDSFLLSCRVLGRGVEYRLMEYLAAEAQRRGVAKMTAAYRPTTKNEPARRFLQQIGQGIAQASKEVRYEWPAAELQSIRWQDAEAHEVPSLPKADKTKQANRRRPDYLRIARSLSTPRQILDAIRGERPAAAVEHAAESSEARLAAIWSELLHKPDIKPSDNFFDLGGHSLLVVLLIVRVRETFGVELSIDDVYEANLTFGDLVNQIEAYQLGGRDEYQALYSEIEALSDEEVKRLLAREDPGVSLS